MVDIVAYFNHMRYKGYGFFRDAFHSVLALV